MAKIEVTLIFMLFIAFGYSQKINDSLYYSSLMKIDTLNYVIPANNYFFYGVHPYNATIFNSFANKSGTSLQMGIGISQQFAINPSNPYWNGSSPLSPMQRNPGSPNFAPMQSSPTFGIKNSAGTFYSFSAGTIDMGNMNRGFRQVKILKPIGKSGR
jgi:hypothetical protein